MFKNPLLQFSQEENIRKTQIEGHSTKYLTYILQNCQDHQKQKKV